MREQEPRPVVSVVEDGGVWQLSVTPVCAIGGLRKCIDDVRTVGLNFASANPSPNHVYVNVGPQHENDLLDALAMFADVQITQPAA